MDDLNVNCGAASFALRASIAIHIYPWGKLSVFGRIIFSYSVLTKFRITVNGKTETISLWYVQSQRSAFVPSPIGKSVPFDQMLWQQYLLGRHSVCSVPPRPFHVPAHLLRAGSNTSTQYYLVSLPTSGLCCSRPAWQTKLWDFHQEVPFQQTWLFLLCWSI